MTWTPEQAAQRREWDLDRLDADTPEHVRNYHAWQARRAARDAAANGQEPSSDGEPEPPDDVELLPEYPFVPLESISTDPPPPMLVDRLDPEGHTILYGTGSSGKGALSCWWIALLVRGGATVLVLDYEDHGPEWSRRIAALAPDVHASGRVFWYRPRRPLWQEAPDVARWCEMIGATYVVIDSAVMGCLGSDPLSPEAAAQYAGGIADLGRPALSLAHVTKSEDSRYPFGSVFWHNLSRTTWNLGVDKAGTILTHRKHNNYAGLGRFVVTITWLDNRLVEVWEKGYSASLADRAAEILAEGDRGIDDLLEAINDSEDEGASIKRDTLRRVLARGIPQRFSVVSGKYHRV